MSSPKGADDATAAVRALTQAVRDLTKQLRRTSDQFAAFAAQFTADDQFREGESGWGFGDEDT
jgi:ABC-type transporter Mla subunit MlaD